MAGYFGPMTEVATPDLPPGVTVVTTEGGGGLEAVRVETQAARGLVYLNGAHLAEWTPAGAEPVLWMSVHSAFAVGSPIRGGVPVCGPWLGPGRSGDRAPAHGWFRISQWTLAGASVDGDGAATLTFTLDGRDAAAAVTEGSSREVRAEYVVTLGRALELALTVSAGTEPLELEEALHTYLAVSDVRSVTVSGLDGVSYVDKVAGGTHEVQAGDVTFSGETDRVYAHEDSATVHDPGLGRRIVLTKEGSGSTVVWNPWVAKSAAMPDFGDDEWPGMVCLEAGNALDSAVLLGPGESHTLLARYELESA